jgi:DNA-binding MarR family transcriptional regulator
MEGVVDRSWLLDPRGRTPAWAMRTLYRLYAQVCKPVHQSEGLTDSQYIVLRTLTERGRLNQVELGQRVALPPTTVTSVLDAMEDHGLLVRVRDRSDRRKQFVELTAAGQEMNDRLVPEMRGIAVSSYKDIAPADLEVFWKVMLTIEKNLLETIGEDQPTD